MAYPEPPTNPNGSENTTEEQKYKYEFRGDSPIELESDDFLSRTDFSRHLAEALSGWKGEESLVLALNGPWGSGKTSLINLTVKSICDKKERSNKNSRWYNKVITLFQRFFKNAKVKESFELPTIIHFNPWVYSEEGNIQKHFFDQIAKELELKNDTVQDKKIAKRMRYYSSILELVSPGKQLSQLWVMKLVKIVFFAALGSLYYTYFESFSQIAIYVIIGLIVLYVLLIVFKSYLYKFASFFESRSEYQSKTLSELKKELQEELRVRGKKLLIIIDDIDRLDVDEIRPLLKLVRSNANFPNTIYLLIFDREVVEKYLQEKIGVQGKDYLGKIVQVRFDIPHVNSSKILTYLDKELDRIIKQLPQSATVYFTSDGIRWQAIINSGFKDFFKNIRDVKRFANSLEFNISKMHQGGVMEVNPIDFIAIEAIRIFLPGLYSFIKNNKDILTQNHESHPLGRIKEDDQKDIDKILLPIIPENSPKIKSLLSYLFPQIGSFLGTDYSYSDGFRIEWNKNLRVCSVNNFDCYFTLIPGGADDEISQFTLQNILTSSGSLKDFESILQKYLKQKKIDKLLFKLHERALDKNNLLTDNRENVIKAMLNIADYLPKEKVISYIYGLDSLLVGIIYELLGQNEIPHENYQVFKNAAESSKGCIGIIKTISSLLPSENEIRVPQLNFSEEDVRGLRELGVTKISKYDWDKLMVHDDLLYILYRWKEWDINNGLKDFLAWAEEDKMRYVRLITRLISASFDFPLEEVAILYNNLVSFKCIRELLNPDEVKSKLEELKSDDSFYSEHRDFFDKALGKP
jgi:predicted KAP-like P-loop ATPase